MKTPACRDPDKRKSQPKRGCPKHGSVDLYRFNGKLRCYVCRSIRRDQRELRKKRWGFIRVLMDLKEKRAVQKLKKLWRLRG